ncbi:MAG: TetR/AcrR family transcriptional regulator [Verrucomicrobia bacterium]|nr:TetR/AcrR family transcriptional regulator [Verrucomicrobiota bacterium]
MNVTPLSRRSTHEQTRQRILAKAGELFRHFGFAKTTVADIAAGLAMSPANIYKFFPSKDAIIQASLEQKLAEVKKSIEAVISSSSGALARIEGLALAVFHWHSELFCREPQLFQLVQLASGHSWDCVCDFKNFLQQTITEIIEAGTQTGEFYVSDTGAAARALIDCLAIVLEPSASPDPNDKLTEKRVRAMVGFLGRALR